MILNIKAFKNWEKYNILKTFDNQSKILKLTNEQDWIDFFLQNKERKNKNQSTNENFLNKRILKNMKGFNSVIESTGFDSKIKGGYFLDYSSYVNIFLYFKNQSSLINYVVDTCEARGEKKVITSFNEAITFLQEEEIVISEVNELEINHNQWDSLIKRYESLIVNNKTRLEKK